jgi:catechol 2,3-dioxygenase-like lactoylglutathione lyase family enzyme
MDLNHTIVPATDKEASAIWFARIMGLTYDGPMGPFCPVRITQALTLDFDDRREVVHHHYAFVVDDQEFDSIFGRVKSEGIAYGSGPAGERTNMTINTREGGRGVYFDDLNGHSLELMTRA